MNLIPLIPMLLFPTPKHKIVIEVDLQGTVIYRAALDHAKNLIKAFAPESTVVEIVCHGAGLDMILSSHNPLAVSENQMEASGVTFSACGNTMKARHIKPTDLITGTRVVDSGVAEVVRKEEAGWSYLKED